MTLQMMVVLSVMSVVTSIIFFFLFVQSGGPVIAPIGTAIFSLVTGIFASARLRKGRADHL